MNIPIIQTALSQYGIREIVGANHNDEILKYFHDIGHEWVKDDETAWCSAFANWVCHQVCVERSNKLNARSWLEIGESTQNPEIGDIVVLWRESQNSWKGHVGFFISQTESDIFILGGNQNNQVNIKPYPKYRFLDYRRLNNIQ